MRAITLRIPSNHPIFLVEAGSRSEVARLWLDMGYELEQLGKKVDKILELLETNPQDVRPVKLDSGSGGFDKKEFLRYFD